MLAVTAQGPTHVRRPRGAAVRLYRVAVTLRGEHDALVVPRRGSWDAPSLIVEPALNHTALLRLELGDRVTLWGPIADLDAFAVVDVVAIAEQGAGAIVRHPVTCNGCQLARCAGAIHAMRHRRRA